MASAFNIEEVAPEEREEYLLEHFSSSTGDDALIEGYTFASWACFIESMRVLRLLSQKKSNLAARNEDGTTALTWAPNSEFTDFLVLKGAKVGDEAPTDGRLSMHRAAKNGLCDQLRTLIVEGNGAELLENFDEFGKTPLAVAASEGHLDAVKLLLESGADPNAYDENHLWYTVLQYAVSQGYQKIAHLLLDYGASIETHGLTESLLDMAFHQEMDSSLVDRLR